MKTKVFKRRIKIKIRDKKQRVVKRNVSLNVRGGMVIILTGNIASGKSYILSILRRLGFRTLESDRMVSEIMLSVDFIADIVKIFPHSTEKLLKSDGWLRKEVISDALFNYNTRDKSDILHKLKQLESKIFPILHKIQRNIVNDIAVCKRRSVILESPLFLESKNDLFYHALLLSVTKPKIQHIRAMSRKNMTDIKFTAIMNRQFDVNVKKGFADLVLNCDGNRLATLNLIKKLLRRDSGTEGSSFRYRDHRFESKRSHNRNWRDRTYQ